MVNLRIDITIYIEGVQSDNNAVLTIDNAAIFREKFHQLFSQQLASEKFNLIIQRYEVHNFGILGNSNPPLTPPRRGKQGCFIRPIKIRRNKEQQKSTYSASNNYF